MNLTELVPSSIQDFYIVCSISGAFFLTAVVVSLMILTLIWKTKPRLHTVRHLLTSNTCIASTLYCIVQANNYVFLIFFPGQKNDFGCRWRGYFSYITLCGVLYSFLIQAISRLFICIFSAKHRWLVTYKVHYILICIQWFVAIVVPLPAIITHDIYSRPNALCWVPMKRTLHVAYTYVVYYVVPTVSICVIYLFIYYRVKLIVNRAQMLVRSINNNTRDLKLLRNIVILLAIYWIGGFPTLLFLVTSKRILYLIGIVSISLAIAIEKISTVLLDRELRQVFRKLIWRTARVVPIGNIQMIRRYQGNNMRIHRGVIQPIADK